MCNVPAVVLSESAALLITAENIAASLHSVCASLFLSYLYQRTFSKSGQAVNETWRNDFFFINNNVVISFIKFSGKVSGFFYFYFERYLF